MARTGARYGYQVIPLSEASAVNGFPLRGFGSLELSRLLLQAANYLTCRSAAERVSEYSTLPFTSRT